MVKKSIVLWLIFSTHNLVALSSDQPTAQDIMQVTQPISQPQPTQPVQPTKTAPKTTTTPTKSTFLTVHQATNPFKNADGSIIKKTDANRYNLPVAAQYASLFMGKSNTYALTKGLFQSYPPASLFFPHNSTMATSFATLLTQIRNEKIFFLFIKRLHCIVLQQTYAYLKKVYANLDLTFINSLQDFVQAEETYALNTKKLIVHHLMNVVDGQSYQFSQSLFPKLEQHIATQVGSMFINSDYMINLNWLTSTQQELQVSGIDPQMIPTVLDWQKRMLRLFKTYFTFFKQYTQQITQPDPTKGFLGISQLVTDAQDIRALTKSQAQKQIPIFPQFFFPSQGTIQALKLIPKLAKGMPTNIKNVPWPAQIVQTAQSGQQPVNAITGASYNYPIAYFKDAKGNETQSQSGATGLYMNMLSGGNLFELELLQQPDWLNNKDAIINIVRGALGDFSALTAYDILDADTKKIITAALSS